MFTPKGDSHVNYFSFQYSTIFFVPRRDPGIFLLTSFMSNLWATGAVTCLIPSLHQSRQFFLLELILSFNEFLHLQYMLTFVCNHVTTSFSSILDNLQDYEDDDFIIF